MKTLLPPVKLPDTRPAAHRAGFHSTPCTASVRYSSMKTFLVLLSGLVLSLCSSYGQMNGYVTVQSPNAAVFVAPKAGSPMYPVPSPVANNYYGGACQQQVYVQPQFYRPVQQNFTVIVNGQPQPFVNGGMGCYNGVNVRTFGGYAPNVNGCGWNGYGPGGYGRKVGY